MGIEKASPSQSLRSFRGARPASELNQPACRRISTAAGRQGSSIFSLQFGRFGALAVFVLTFFSTIGQAHAGEIQLDAGTALMGSSWQGDFTGGGFLRLGYRFKKIIALDIVTWEQLGVVDQRLDTGLTIGVTGFIPLKHVRPSLRIFAIHQHEEGTVSVAQTPGGVLFGIGSGIRHRAGGGLTLGAEIPLYKKGDLEWVMLAELEGIWLPDALGPTFYYGGNLGLGFNFDVAKLP